MNGVVLRLITVEDIVEEVLGEIRDPYDIEQNLINKIEDATIW